MRSDLVVVALTPFVVTAGLLAQQVPIHVLSGRSGAFLGTSVSPAGDQDQDGSADVVLGAPNDPPGRLIVFSGRTAAILREIEAPEQYTSFGSTVALAGDVDGDGAPDFIAGSPAATTANPTAGRVTVHSGRTGNILHSWIGDAALDRLGTLVCGVGDVDRDGTPDVAATAPQDNGNQARGPGYVRVWSGRDGRVLHSLASPGPGTSTRIGLAAAGDLDADGHADIAVGWTNWQNSSVRVYSGRDGRVLLEVRGAVQTYFGAALAGMGDVDGDGVPDLAIGMPTDPTMSYNTGAVRIVSGRTGAALTTVPGAGGRSLFGWSVACPGDLDGDGVADLLAGAYDGISSGLGYARLCSGRTGVVLRHFEGANSGGEFGTAVAAAGDADGDGHQELLVGAPWENGWTGRAYLFSGRPRARAETMGPGCSATALVPILEATLPVLGGSGAFLGRDARPMALGSLFLGMPAAQPIPVTPARLVYLDPPTALGIVLFTADATGRWSQPFNVPAAPGLAGVRLAAQAALWLAPSPLGVDLTNGLALTVGY